MIKYFVAFSSQDSQHCFLYSVVSIYVCWTLLEEESDIDILQTASGLLLICMEPILHQGHTTARASPTSLHSIVFRTSKLAI